MIQKFVIVLCVILLCIACSNFSNGLFLNCDNSCEVSSLNQSYIEEQCCHDDSHVLPYGIPPKKPHDLRVNFYVVENATGNCRAIAFNITWGDIAQHALSEESKGYVLKISRIRSSSVTSVIIKLSKPLISKSTTQRSELIINYKLYGLTEDTTIDVGHAYFIRLYALPMPHSEVEVHSMERNRIEVPDCKNSEVLGTCGCPYPHPESTTTSASTIPKSTTQGNITSIKTHPLSSTPMIMVIVLVGFVFLVILFAFIYLITKRIEQHSYAKISCQKLFVVISSHDVNMKSRQSRDVDQICRFFENHGLEVTYTLWRATELSQTNTIQWVTDHLEKADHVILVLTKAALSELDVKNSETQPFLNRAFDPCTIVRKKMETSLDKKSDKFSILYFQDDVTIPSTLFHIKSRFRLPADAWILGRKLGGNNVNTGKALQNLLAAKPVEKRTSPIVLYNHSNGKVVDHTFVSSETNGHCLDEQVDSGFVSNHNSFNISSRHI